MLVAVFAFTALAYKEGRAPAPAEGSLSGVLVADLRTDRKYYLMDPYYWVYSAAKFRWWYPPYKNPHFWPEEGYNRTVNLSFI